MLREIQEFDIDSSTEFYYIIKDSHSSIEDLKPIGQNRKNRCNDMAQIYPSLMHNSEIYIDSHRDGTFLVAAGYMIESE